MSTVIVVLDISAAFDTICHSKLLDRLRDEFGFEGVALTWIESYLSGWSQFVRIGQQSSTSKLHSGIPQGSVLWPLLFAAYVSPVRDVIRKAGLKHHQYADDTQLYLSMRSTHYRADLNQIEECTLTVHDWFLDNDLQLNPSKSEAMSLGTVVQYRTIIGTGTVAVAGHRCNSCVRSSV